MLPASVDQLVVAASIYMLVCRRAGLRSGALTWLALLGGSGANVAAAAPIVLGRVVALGRRWPSLSPSSWPCTSAPSTIGPASSRAARGGRHDELGSHGTRALAAALPRRHAELEDPDAFFAALDDEATEYYASIRDGLLEGVNPNYR